MRLPAPLALLVAAGLLLVSAPSANAAIAYAPCSPGATVQCGTLDVPLDRSGAVPGSVRLVAARVVAPSNPTNTAIIGLVGGPGGDAIPLISGFARELGPALATRDLLMFDPRGTGASSPVRCSLNQPTRTETGTRCASELGARRGLLTTAVNVEDIEALRAASGYEKLVLFGVSYGTKVALDYAARYPTRVAGILLDSVVLPQGADPLQRSTFTAMRRVLGELCAGGACNGISANPSGDLAARVRSLARRPLLGIRTTADGRRERVQINRTDLFDVLVDGDLNPALRAELPGALTSARRGDSAPLIRLVARAADVIGLQRQAEGTVNDAVYLATLCEESLFPWDRGASITARSQQVNAAALALGEAAFSPFDVTTALTSDTISLCVGWPVASPPPAPPGPLPNVPTLVVDGATDIRTPLEDAVQVKQLIPAAQVLRIPYTGHSAIGTDVTDEQCGVRAMRQFFIGEVVTPCAASANPFSPTPVAPRKFKRLKATGHGGKVGRTITAALATAQDMRRQAIGDLLQVGRYPSRIGGLRGGRAVVRNRSMTLFDVTLVPGVQVSGSVPLGSGRQVLRLRGTNAARGTITVTETTITGRLGGRKISLVARSAGAGTGSSDTGWPSIETLRDRFRPLTAR